jgi:formylglycine-generating enzyme required for sulfatase activity
LAVPISLASCGKADSAPDASIEVPWPIEAIEEGWVHVPPGTFLYGAPEKPHCWGMASAQAEVTLTRGFVIPPTEVTRARWRAVGFPDPSASGAPECDDCPVGRINWYEALAYANALSRKAGLPECYRLENCVGTIGAGCPPITDEKGYRGCSGEVKDIASYYICPWPVHRYPDRYSCPGYRLPTAAEWQYAARAGTPGDTYNGDVGTNLGNCEESEVLEPIAWYCHNSDERAHAVGQKQPNPWGLYDMLGNQWELIDHIDSGLPLEIDEGHPPPLVDPIGRTEPISLKYESFGRKGGGWPSGWSECWNNVHMVMDTCGNERRGENGFRPVRTVLAANPESDAGPAMTTDPAAAGD